MALKRNGRCCHKFMVFTYVVFVTCILLWYANAWQKFMPDCVLCFVRGCSRFCSGFIILNVFRLLLFKRFLLDQNISGSRFLTLVAIFISIGAIPIFLSIFRNEIPREVFGAYGDNSWFIFSHFVSPGNLLLKRKNIWDFTLSAVALCLVSGLMVASITNWMNRRVADLDSGACRYYPSIFGTKNTKGRFCRWFFGRHAIIIGGHLSLIDVCRQLQKDGIEYIFVITTESIDRLRSALLSAEGVDEERIVLYRGQITDKQEIAGLYPQHADSIHILGENEITPDHDVQIMKCVQLIADELKPYVREGYKVKKCFVQFEYQTAFSVFQSSDTPGVLKNAIEFIPYSFYEGWAQRVFVTNADESTVEEKKSDRLERYKRESEHYPHEYKYLPLDGTGIGVDSKKRVHIVIVGMSKMGIAMAIEAANVAHYPNFVKNPKYRTLITFIDIEADKQKDFFMGRFENLFKLSRWRYVDCTEKDLADSDADWEVPSEDYLDVEWEFIKGGVETNNIKKYLEKCADSARNYKDQDQEGSLLTVAVCLPNEHEALAAALYLPKDVYKYARQILVYQRTDCSVIDNVNGFNLYALKDDDSGEKFFNKLRYKKLLPFGMHTYNGQPLPEMQIIAHAAARVYDSFYDKRFDRLGVVRFIEDFCEVAFDEALHDDWAKKEVWSQWSNIYNANTISTKMRSIKASKALCVNANDPFGDIAECAAGSEIENDNCRRITLNGAKFSHIFKSLDLNNTPSASFEKQLHLAYYMTVVEHNRWNMEKLLLGYRPLEQGAESEGSIDDIKKLSKDLHRAHHCIRSYENLVKWDDQHNIDMIGLDVGFTLMLPYLSTKLS